MSAMTRAIRLSMPDPMADLKLLADKVFAAATPAASQALQFNIARLDGDLFRLECEYDPSEPWPTDFVALELAAWRAALTFHSLELALLSVRRTFEQCAVLFRDGQFGYGLIAQAQLIANGAGHG